MQSTAHLIKSLAVNYQPMRRQTRLFRSQPENRLKIPEKHSSIIQFLKPLRTKAKK